MAELCGSAKKLTISECRIDELDYVPLTQRRKLLRATKWHSGQGGIFENGIESQTVPHLDVVMKKEDGYCNSSQIRCREVDSDVAGQENLSVDVCILHKGQTLPVVPAKVEVEYFENLLSSLGNSINGCAGTDVSAAMVNNEILNDFVDDDCDHIVLKERRRRLLSRKLLDLAKPVVTDSSGGLPQSLTQQSAEKGKEETHPVDEVSQSGNKLYDNTEKNSSGAFRSFGTGSPHGITTESSVGNQHSCELTKPVVYMEIHASNSERSSEKMFFKSNSCEAKDSVSASTSSVHTPDLSTFVKVKVEPSEDNNCNSLDRNEACNFPLNKLQIKNEPEVSDPLCVDEVDHIRLQDRMKIPILVEDPDLNIPRKVECLKKSVPSALGHGLVALEYAEPIRINRPCKRRKTATDSVETALEEDAPGLLKVLVDKGISVDEIKLYGETGNDEALDESFSEDSFAELEDVISKIFSQRESFLKFAPVRCAKGARASYCLACLFSLVEQTRYLQFRRWPVEWGWCRDLQSFLFVFNRHNRIVLERPEYGYATYFFEIVDTLPIDWQIKRLVTAMKLSSCSRVSLIENKVLVVGEDLTEAEAKVLMEYGWVPNSGLGTMLNYCDRVVHDRKNEKDSSEWRSKIAKLLMDGYNGGIMVATDIPKKVEDYIGSPKREIKSEF